MAKQDAPVLEVKKDRRFLMCALTAEELAGTSDALARYIDDSAAIKDELDTIKAQFKGRTEQCEANIKAAARLIRDKKELRTVDIEVRSDYTNCTITVVRLDTNEVVEAARPMTGEEKQLQIDFDETA